MGRTSPTSLCSFDFLHSHLFNNIRNILHGRQRPRIPASRIRNAPAPTITAVQKERMACTTVKCTELQLQRLGLTEPRTSTPESPPTSPIITYPSFPSPFETAHTSSISSSDHSTRKKDYLSKQPPISSSPNWTDTAKNIWRRSSGQQCPITLRTFAPDSVPACGASSTSSR